MQVPKKFRPSRRSPTVVTSVFHSFCARGGSKGRGYGIASVRYPISEPEKRYGDKSTGKAHTKEKKTRGTDVHTMGIQKSTTDGCRFGSDQPGRAKKGFNAAYEGGIGGISRKGAIVGQGSPRIDQGGIRPCKIWGRGLEGKSEAG